MLQMKKWAIFTPFLFAKKPDRLDIDRFIESYCHIRHNVNTLNGITVVQSDEYNFPDFIKSVYKKLELDYAKFFKMDNLSKLGFMAAEVLFTKGLTIHGDEKIAIALSNRASSLDTDRKYQTSINDADNYYPSPGVFVYTLPNICIGEISIRHKLQTENSFFIFDALNSGYLKDFSDNLLDTQKADKVLCGWVDIDRDRYEAFLYLVSHTRGQFHTEEEIIRLYTTK